MTVYSVTIAPRVRDQIREQVQHIAEDSTERALAWESRLIAALIDLGTLPSGHPFNEYASRQLGIPVRRMVFERTYLVFYSVNDARNEIEVIQFRHGARLPRPGEV